MSARIEDHRPPRAQYHFDPLSDWVLVGLTVIVAICLLSAVMVEALYLAGRFR